MKIRVAELEDIAAMVRLSEAFRATLSGYSPTFWRPAADAATKQAAWFEMLLPLADHLVFVADTDGELRGFIIGRLQEAPPVYAPGGSICLVDDFCVAADAEWASVGNGLLDAVESAARSRGAMLSVVICPRLASAKRGMLGERGCDVATEWHVRSL